MHIKLSSPGRRGILAAALGVSLSGLCLACGTTWKIAPVLLLLFFLAAWRVHVSGKAAWLIWPALAILCAGLTIFLSQEAIGMRTLLPKKYYVYGALCLLALMLALYFVSLLFSRGLPRLAIALPMGAALLISVANSFLVAVRNTVLTPFDLQAAPTAMRVLGQYKLELTPHICYVIAAYCLLLFFLSGLRVEKPERMALYRLGALALTVATLLGARAALADTPVYVWFMDSYQRTGFLLNFMAELNLGTMAQPAGYSAAAVRETEGRYDAPAEAPEKLPNIVVIMNESLADLRVVGPFETDRPFMPFLDALREDTVRGFALSSVYGGTTANSEYEFLTGNSMAFTASGCIPFLQMIKDPAWSLARYLAGFGYTSYVTHPAEGGNWNRERIYPLLGFEEMEFLPAYDGAEQLSDMVTDAALYEHLIAHYEAAAAQGAPQFIFAVTMQNHGGYDRGDFEPELAVTGWEDREVDTYLSLVRRSDAAFRTLLDYFAGREEPVVVLMFGDHQPAMTEEFLAWLHGCPLESLQKRELKYIIPYVIWANYDIEEKTPALTSINYLSVPLLEAAGLPQAPYTAFLSDAMRTVPALNALGYFSPTSNAILPLESAAGQEAAVLGEYAVLEYNALRGGKDRSEVFFPIP